MKSKREVRTLFFLTITTEEGRRLTHLAWTARYLRTLQQGSSTRQCLSHPGLASNAATLLWKETALDDLLALVLRIA
jgi:hypothetical protein